jgi:hypothetical protein
VLTETTKLPAALWTGRILTALVAVYLLWDGFFQLFGSLFARAALQHMAAEGGWRLEQTPPVGAAVLVSTILYLIPRTAVLGAILVSGFLGGAIATELRVGGSIPEIFALMLGILAWGGLYLRDARIRQLLPWTS